MNHLSRLRDAFRDRPILACQPDDVRLVAEADVPLLLNKLRDGKPVAMLNAKQALAVFAALFRDDTKAFGTVEVAACCRLDPRVLRNWINAGIVQADSGGEGGRNGTFLFRWEQAFAAVVAARLRAGNVPLDTAAEAANLVEQVADGAEEATVAATK